MGQKGVINIWLEYAFSRFGDSLDRKLSVQKAIKHNDFALFPEILAMNDDERKALIMDIRGAARDYYFKGHVPEYYKDVLRNYKRSVLYHLLHKRNYD